MLRSAFIIFLAGWVTWFLLDKPAGMQAGKPRPDGDMLSNFQQAFNMLKAGHPDLAFIFIWQQHYLVLSLLAGLLLAVLTGSVRDYLGRRRMRRLVLPRSVATGDGEDKRGPGPGGPGSND